MSSFCFFKTVLSFSYGWELNTIELIGLFLVCLLRFNEILEEAANVMEVNYMGWNGLGMVVGSL